MKSVIEVIRKTSLFFQPQIRTKIMNEGWSSYWHETLFLKDDRIRGREVEFARVNAGVTSMPRVGLNPYALGMRLFYFIEEAAEKGRYSLGYRKLTDAGARERFDAATGGGKDYIFKVREDFCDFTFINTFVDQDFIDRNRLFVAGKRLDQDRMVWQYYVKSRKAEDYREMLFDALYHPPKIEIDPEKSRDGSLYLVHRFEHKPLVKDFIANTMMGIEFLWGGPVKLETSEVFSSAPAPVPGAAGFGRPPKEESREAETSWHRVLYKMENRKLSRQIL
jgi:stage V sporulation protein R